VEPYSAVLVLDIAKAAAGALDLLTSRLKPSVLALVIPVSMNASISGHQVSTVPARVCSSSIVVDAHQS
jgi:hypothetical protein